MIESIRNQNTLLGLDLIVFHLSEVFIESTKVKKSVYEVSSYKLLELGRIILWIFCLLIRIWNPSATGKLFERHDSELFGFDFIIGFF